MKFYRKITISAAIASLLLCGSAFAEKPTTVVVENDPSNPVPVTGVVDVTSAPATHMGQRVENHVSLVTGSGTSTTCPSGQLAAYRKLSDGDTPFDEFVVPDDMTFILTDIAIGLREADGNDWVAGESLISMELSIGESANDNMWRASIQIDELMAASEEAWFTEHLVSGVAIGQGKRVCIKAGFFFSATPGTVTLINYSRMYGYLVPN